MASNTKNKYPADKAGTKYSEFRNTKRVSAGKATTATTTNRASDKEGKSGTGTTANTANAS